jgi:adenosine deaminase
LTKHPLRAFLYHGILATINTDDPSVCGITLSHELTITSKDAGLTPEEISKARLNAMKVAFFTEGDKAAILSQYPDIGRNSQK